VKIALTPIDTLFFRDSTPFDLGTTAQDGVASVFPPHPPTVAGAIRAALARAKGWNGRDPWGAALVAALGDGADLGPLRMIGPVVLQGDAPVFPLPRHVVAARVGAPGDAVPIWHATGWFAPGEPVDCDLGRVRLPMPVIAAGESDVAGGKASRAVRPWVTIAGLRQILDQHLPASAELVDSKALWVEEPRVGIQRSPDSRTVERGMLYSTRHVRLRPDVRIGLELTGLPSDWPSLVDARARRPHPATVALGGEGRLATVASWDGLALDAPVGEARTTGRLTLIALTPLRLERGAIAGRAPLASGLRIACACADRPLRIGGWDSRRRSPVTLTNAIAPGTTLFCEAGADARDAFGADLERGMIRIGRDVAAGFGLCAVARDSWKETP
jgi:CRISPR-associated protein Cmr3